MIVWFHTSSVLNFQPLFLIYKSGDWWFCLSSLEMYNNISSFTLSLMIPTFSIFNNANFIDWPQNMLKKFSLGGSQPCRPRAYTYGSLILQGWPITWPKVKYKKTKKYPLPYYSIYFKTRGSRRVSVFFVWSTFDFLPFSNIKIFINILF